MNPGLRLSRDQCPKSNEERQEMKDIPYISAVGSVMYLAMMTRPDIAEPASVLARFNSNPGIAHWKAVKHLLRYLAGTLEMELELGPDPDCNMLKMRPSVVATHYKCCSSCLTLLHTQCTL